MQGFQNMACTWPATAPPIVMSHRLSATTFTWQRRRSPPHSVMHSMTFFSTSGPLIVSLQNSSCHNDMGKAALTPAYSKTASRPKMKLASLSCCAHLGTNLVAAAKPLFTAGSAGERA